MCVVGTLTHNGVITNALLLWFCLLSHMSHNMPLDDGVICICLIDGWRLHTERDAFPEQLRDEHMWDRRGDGRGRRGERREREWELKKKGMEETDPLWGVGKSQRAGKVVAAWLVMRQCDSYYISVSFSIHKHPIHTLTLTHPHSHTPMLLLLPNILHTRPQSNHTLSCQTPDHMPQQ